MLCLPLSGHFLPLLAPLLDAYGAGLMSEGPQGEHMASLGPSVTTENGR